MSEIVGIAGTGAIACGLAAVVAQRGSVVVWARSDGSAERADVKVRSLCEKVGAHVNGNVNVTCDSAALADASFVVEAIVEDPEAKAALLLDLAPRLRDDAILATTTSSLSITELAEASGRPDRFVGLHVFNPVPKMDLIELAFPPAATATHARGRARSVRGARQDRGRGPGHGRLRRQPAAVPVPVRGRAADGAHGARAGGDRHLHAAGRRPPAGAAGAARPRRARRHRRRSARRSAPTSPSGSQTMIADGALGRKTGRGFYTYDD